MRDIPREILKQAASGDLKAFEALYRATADFVYNVAYRVANNRQDAEEVTQDVFLAVREQLSRFRMDSSFKTWIYRIAVNAAINKAKKVTREAAKHVVYNEEAIPESALGSSPGRTGGEEEIGALLGALNADQRACIVLRGIEELSYREIADTLRISINTVRTRLKRAREKLLAMRGEMIGHGM